MIAGVAREKLKRHRPEDLTAEDIAYERVAEYEWWADAYGWTPKQVEELPMWYRTRAPYVRAIREQVRAEKVAAASHEPSYQGAYR